MAKQKPLLHKAFVATEIAIRYYKITHPERKYSRHYAIRQWRQDKKIDKGTVWNIINQVINDQRKTLIPDGQMEN